jgi:hypothetical protein
MVLHGSVLYIPKLFASGFYSWFVYLQIFFTRSTTVLPWGRNVAKYHASFWRRMWIAFKVGIRSFGVPLYLGLRPRQAICSYFALSKMSYGFGGGTGLFGRCPRTARVHLASDSRTKSSLSSRSENSKGVAVWRNGVGVLPVLFGVVAIGLGDPGGAIGEEISPRKKKEVKLPHWFFSIGRKFLSLVRVPTRLLWHPLVTIDWNTPSCHLMAGCILRWNLPNNNLPSQGFFTVL